MLLSTRESGLAGAPTVVLLHGGGVSGWSWDAQAEALSDYHVLVPDLPGHGQSQAFAPLTIPGAARQVAELIAARAHGGRAHVVGLSLGAQIGLQLLATEPERVCRAMLSGTFVLPPGGRSPVQNRLLRKLLSWSLAAYMPLRNMPWLVDLNRRSIGVPPRFAPQFAADTKGLTAQSFMELIDANQAFRLPDGVTQSRVPVLLVAGEKELTSIRRGLSLLAAALPNAAAYLIPGVGHNWNLETPERFNAVLRAWLGGQPLPDNLIEIPANGGRSQ